MMRGFSLKTIPEAHKWALTGFLILALVHVFVVTPAMALFHSGATTGEIRDYYLGNEEREDVPIEALRSPKTTAYLVTFTHYHAAVMPIFAFLLAHVVAMTTLVGHRTKLALIAATYGGLVLEVAVPWLVVAVSPALASLRHVSRATILVTVALDAGLPLYEMWWAGRRAS